MKPLTKKKIQLIKGEIRRWLYTTFMPEKMEVQRLQIFAGIVERKYTSWRDIPVRKRSIIEIIKLTEDPDSVRLSKSVETTADSVTVKYKTKENESNINRTGDTK